MNRCSTTLSIFQITAVALCTRLYRFAASVLSLNEANGDSTRLAGRRCCQCSLGHMYTTSSSSRRRPRHSDSSMFHLSFSLATIAEDTGASSPRSPLSARWKSPSDRPRRYSWGKSSDTSLVLRVNSGSGLLSNFSSMFLTLGLLTSIVPALRVSFLGLAYPLR